MPSSSLSSPKKTWDDSSPSSYDSIGGDAEAPAIANGKANGNTLTSDVYDAAAIRAEFRFYHSILPKPDKLLQEQHSVEILRDMIERSNSLNEMPRFLKTVEEGGIEPHNALCCLLLDDFQRNKKATTTFEVLLSSWLIWALSLGRLYRNAHYTRRVYSRSVLSGRACHTYGDDQATCVATQDSKQWLAGSQLFPRPGGWQAVSTSYCHAGDFARWRKGITTYAKQTNPLGLALFCFCGSGAPTRPRGHWWGRGHLGWLGGLSSANEHY